MSSTCGVNNRRNGPECGERRRQTESCVSDRLVRRAPRFRLPKRRCRGVVGSDRQIQKSHLLHSYPDGNVRRCARYLPVSVSRLVQRTEPIARASRIAQMADAGLLSKVSSTAKTTNSACAYHE